MHLRMQGMRELFQAVDEARTGAIEESVAVADKNTPRLYRAQ